MKKFRFHTYLLYLIDYKDGRVVFSNKPEHGKEKSELQARKDIFKSLFSGERIPTAEYSTYDFKPFMNLTTNVVLAEIGFYHHRIIAHIEAESAEEVLIESIKRIREGGKDIIKGLLNLFKDKINTEDSLDPCGKIEGYFGYQLVIVEKSRKLMNNLDVPFSFQTTSLSFDIIKPTFLMKKLLVRISLPCTMVFGNIEVNNKNDKLLVRDFINSIYQCALYGRKKRMVKTNAACAEPYDMDEQDLQELWAFMMDSMGGKPSHVFNFKMNRSIMILTYLVVLLTLLLLCDIAAKFLKPVFSQVPGLLASAWRLLIPAP